MVYGGLCCAGLCSEGLSIRFLLLAVRLLVRTPQGAAALAAASGATASPTGLVHCHGS